VELKVIVSEQKRSKNMRFLSLSVVLVLAIALGAMRLAYTDWGAFDSWLVAELGAGEGQQKRTACRLENAICKKGAWNTIEFYFCLPPEWQGGNLCIGAETNTVQDIYIQGLTLTLLGR
jgi:hypothetical protein